MNKERIYYNSLINRNLCAKFLLTYLANLDRMNPYRDTTSLTKKECNMCNSNCKLCDGHNGFNHVNETSLKAEWMECPNSLPKKVTYFITMIDNITQETFTVAMPAVSLYEARKQAFLDWWQSSNLV